MAFVRLPIIVVGMAVAYAVFALRGRPDAAALTLLTPTFVMAFVNLISLALLVLLTGREGRRLRDLVGFDRGRIGRDVAWGLLLLIVLNVPFAIAIAATTFALTHPSSPAEIGAAFERVFVGPLADLRSGLPLWMAVFGAVTFPLLNPVVEEMHYRGYTHPRLEDRHGSASIAIVITAAGFAIQHVAFAVTALGVVVLVVGYFVWGLGASLFYNRERRLPPLIVTHFVINLSSAAVPLVLLLTETNG
jgi:CAAX protease family protein